LDQPVACVERDEIVKKNGSSRAIDGQQAELRGIALGRRHATTRGASHLLTKSTRRQPRKDAVTNRISRDGCAHAQDAADPLEPWGTRQRISEHIRALDGAQISDMHRRRFHSDDDFIRSRIFLVDLDYAQYIARVTKALV
jgi:hypothetical protein